MGEAARGRTGARASGRTREASEGAGGSTPERKEDGGAEEDASATEKRRRARISKANKGNVPWNKGRRHSPETIAKIRARTRAAMARPDVRKKVEATKRERKVKPVKVDDETRKRIAEGVKAAWERRRKLGLVSPASDKPKRKPKPQTPRKPRAKKTGETKAHAKPRSEEHRQKLSEAMRARWADPEYRAKFATSKSDAASTSDTDDAKPRAGTEAASTAAPAAARKDAPPPEDDPTHAVRMAEAWRKVAEAEARLAKLEAQVLLVRPGDGNYARLGTAMASARSNIAIATQRLIPLSQHHQLAALPDEERGEDDGDADADANPNARSAEL